MTVTSTVEGSVHDPPAGRFEGVFEAHREAVLGYLLRRTDSAHDAADLLAETFLVAWRRLDDVPHGAETRPWLYGVARRVLANHRRGEGRRIALADKLRAELAETGQRGPEPEGPAADAYRMLPEQDRELLALVAWEGLDTGEVAIVLGCSRNAVRIRLHRARKRFANLLGGTSRRVLATSEEAHHEEH